MDANEYQRLAARTLITKPDFQITDEQVMLVWVAVGLADEASEVLDEISKAFIADEAVDTQALKKELGDNCWYCSGLAKTIGVNLQEIMPTYFPATFEEFDDSARGLLAAVDLNLKAGAILGEIKKGVFHQHGVSNEKIKNGLAEILRLIAYLAQLYDYDLDTIFCANIVKLETRYPDGWDHQKSINRVENLSSGEGAE